MIDVFITDDFIELVDPKVLENAGKLALAHEKIVGEVELTIVVDSDERLKELNRQYLGIDAPTDVLSFPADEFDPDTGLRYLGDMIISFPTALAQAEKAGVATVDELQLLVIHGILHLLGYDHAIAKDKDRMWKVQADILKQMGITITRLPE